MLQKAEKREDTDSEFCKGRRCILANKENHVFFAGSDILDENRYNTTSLYGGYGAGI